MLAKGLRQNSYEKHTRLLVMENATSFSPLLPVFVSRNGLLLKIQTCIKSIARKFRSVQHDSPYQVADRWQPLWQSALLER